MKRMNFEKQTEFLISNFAEIYRRERKNALSIQLKSLLVADTRGDHPISRSSVNQIAPFQPRDAKLAVRSEFLSTLTKVELATKLQ